MYLYNVTLQRATGCQTAVYGNFSGPKAQEIVVSRGSLIDLLRPDENGKMQLVVSVFVFGQIRDLAAFRLTGGQRDYICVGSDSGRFVVLEYLKDKNQFAAVHVETYGKSGCRRIVPGQFLAVDPKGRAAMIGACEKQKLVYVFNRDTAANLTISSPLEAHKSHTLVFSIVAVDCGFDNPMFAAIELDYAEADQDSTGEAAAEAQKHLTFYELDLGLNHVVRKYSEPVDNGANMLLTVPGGADGPSGVLVCAENFIIYKKEGHPDVRAVIPRRNDLPGDRGVLLITATTSKVKSGFFFLVQSEYGDIYKVSLQYKAGRNEGEMEVDELQIKYFDTLPPCTSICFLKTGFLFAGSEFGNHALYQFQGMGDHEDDVESSSATLMETDEGFQPVFFDPRPLRNLALIDEMVSLAPFTDMKPVNMPGEETPVLVGAIGRGPRSSLRMLRQGVALTEMAVSDLPGNPEAVWTVRKSAADDFDAYIVVSFNNATLVLSIGETVEEVYDSGFLGTTPSMKVGQIGEDSLFQVYPAGLRHIRADRRVNEWKAPGRKQVQQVASNSRQIILALSGGEIIYFELDSTTGQLLEVEKKELSGGEISCLDVGPVPVGRQRAKFLAVGFHAKAVRVLSLDPENCLGTLAVQATGAPPVTLMQLDTGMGGDGLEDEENNLGSLFLNIGLENGVLMRTEIDRVTGQLADSRIRQLGTRPPKLFPVTVRGRQAMLALSSRPWIGYSDAGRFIIAPLSYDTLDYASSFASDQCPEGIVGIANSKLRIVTIERLGEVFNQASCKLRYTPRKMCVHTDGENPRIIVVQADHGSASTAAALEERETKKKAPKAESMDVDGDDEDDDEEEEEEAFTPEEQFGASKASEGQWASCIQVVDMGSKSQPAEVLSTIEMNRNGEDNEAALSTCTCSFAKFPGKTFIAAGTAKDLSFYPRSASGGAIYMFRLQTDGTLALLHKTPIDEVPACMCSFQDKLLVGMGTTLRMYDLGKKKMLRKCELKGFPSFIATLNVCGDRIYVGDLQHSFQFVKYKSVENSMYVFADDLTPRWITAALQLDYDTMAAADKFGNLAICRLPSEISDEVEDDPTGGKIIHTQGMLNGAPNKVEQVVQFHVGETVSSLCRTQMQPGGAEAMLYATLMGTIGGLLPFTSREDVDFFNHLEMHMRQENPPLCGRDHMAYRSAYFPVKDVIDGDLCEQYAMLSSELQRKIAEELDRTPSEILKKLEDMRAKMC